MKIETLALFCDIIRFRNFTKAAEKNSVSQSRASQVLAMLEESFGTQLIERAQKPWKLTREGRILYEESLEIVARYRDTLERLKKARSFATISLGVIYSVAIKYNRLFIKDYKGYEPGVEINVQSLHPDEIEQGIMNNELDLGIVSFPEEDKRFEIIPWKKERMVLACSPDHELASENEIDVEHIAGERMVMFDKTLRIRDELDGFLAENGLKDPVVGFEFDNIESMKQAVENGNGIAIIPQTTFQREVKHHMLCAVPFKNSSFFRQLSIIIRKGHEKLPKIRTFIEFLVHSDSIINNEQNILQEHMWDEWQP